MGGKADDGSGAMSAASLGGMQHGGTAADEIVHDQRRACLDLPGQEAAAYPAFAAVLFHHRQAWLAAGALRQGLAKQLSPLKPAGVGRDHRTGLLAQALEDGFCQCHPCFQMLGAAAKGILESLAVVHLQRHHAIHAHGLQQLAKLVVHADPRLVVQGMQDIDVAPAHATQGAQFALAILEAALLMRSQRQAQLRRHLGAKRLAGAQCEQQRFFQHYATSSVWASRSRYA